MNLGGTSGAKGSSMEQIPREKLILQLLFEERGVLWQ
jgi:hypothetical protein